MTTPLPLDSIFVFGSNLAGRHGKGSAKTALLRHGAVYGQGEGLQGNSYGIPTKDSSIRTMDLDRIAAAVARFIDFARQRPMWNFRIVNIGCLNAGYKPEQIAPMFSGAPKNCYFSPAFVEVLAGLGEHFECWEEMAARLDPQPQLF